MARLFLALVGVILLAITALALIWVLGQVLVGVGVFVVGAAGVLGRLLWYLTFTGLLAGLVYFVASAWGPVGQRPPVQAAPQPQGAARGGRTQAVQAGGAVKLERADRKAEPAPGAKG